MSQRTTVRRISSDEHLAYIATRPSVSFLQTPAWGRVKSDWKSESIGFFDGDTLVGAGLVLYRKVPKLKRYLAYLPEGPDLPWFERPAAEVMRDFIEPMVDYLRDAGAFAVRIGPSATVRTWGSARLKAALAAGAATRLGEIEADFVDERAGALAAALTAAGWQPPTPEEGFGAGQPQYVFQLPIAGQTEASLLKGFNQLWRRNIKKAEKLGVTVTRGTREDLPAFHTLYVETAKRDGFIPRPLSYFEGMWDAMTGEDPDRIRLYLSKHEGDLVAATTMVVVGEHSWYSYGASSTNKREVRGSNAIQWHMIRESLAAGATVYDLRGITDTLDPDDAHVGLIQFKLGTGGEAVELFGEWTLPVSKAITWAFDQYMKRRG